MTAAKKSHEAQKAIMIVRSHTSRLVDMLDYYFHSLPVYKQLLDLHYLRKSALSVDFNLARIRTVLRLDQVPPNGGEGSAPDRCAIHPEFRMSQTIHVLLSSKRLLLFDL